MFTEADLEPIVDRVIAANKPVIEKQGKGAFGMLMGAVMKEVRGKANPSCQQNPKTKTPIAFTFKNTIARRCLKKGLSSVNVDESLIKIKQQEKSG